MPSPPRPVVDSTGPVQWDERGRPYWNVSDGSRHYIPPVVAAQYRDDPRMLAWAKSQGATLAGDPGGITSGTSVPGAGFFRSRGVWNSREGTYDQPINWGNLASLALGGAMAGPMVGPLIAKGVGSLGSAFGGGGAGAGGGGAAAAEAALGTVVPGAAGGLTLGTVVKNLIPLAAPLIGLASGGGGEAGGGGGGASGTDLLTQYPQLQELLAISAERSRRTDPLHQAITQLAMGRLPTSVQR